MSRIAKAAVLAATAGAALSAAAGAAVADSGTQGAAMLSPGLGSGNLVQAPIHVPVNACGDTVSVIGVANPALGNSCANR
ncbi:chaplin [Streptomyces sp. NPDC001922]|uniref:chaplin n=1 Tax=Streptomyces sp. NPDC001922 TaxID=3364624 RepID=UPI00369545E0